MFWFGFVTTYGLLGELVALDTLQRLKEQHGENNITIEYDHENEVKRKTLPLNTQDAASFLYKTMNAGQIISVHSQEATLADVFGKLIGSFLHKSW